MTTHKLTNQKLLLKKSYGGASTYFVLDDEGNKIPDLNSNGVKTKTENGDTIYKIAVCLDVNVN